MQGNNINEIKIQIEKLEHDKLMIDFKDHLTNDDWEEKNRISNEISKLKQELKKYE